jgi:hypothetical protein
MMQFVVAARFDLIHVRSSPRRWRRRQRRTRRGPSRSPSESAVHDDDRQGSNFVNRIVRRLQPCPGVAEMVTYEVGPSVGAHSGPGNIGVVYAPVSL